MAYFPTDIPFMSEEELRENGIRIPRLNSDAILKTKRISYDTVSRSYLLSEYDRQHKGPPGGARKMIETAPPVDVIPVDWIMEQIREQNFDPLILSRMLRAWRAENE